MSIQIHRITNANIYLAGNNLLGRASEIKLPEVQAKMTEHAALGLVGMIELPSGFEKLEGEIKWNSLYADAAKIAANPFESVQLIARSSVDQYGSGGRVGQIPLITTLTVMFKKNSLGSFKQNDNAEFDSGFSATYLKQTLDGNDIVELDYLANIFKVGGEDQLETYRGNIGG